MTRVFSSKSRALGIVALLAGAAMLAWSMTWFVVDLAPGESLDETLVVGGDAAAPALVPLALSALALVAALAIASPPIRVGLAVVLALLGVGVTVTSALAVIRPVDAVASSVVTSTGLDGESAVAAAILSVSGTPWPVIAGVVGLLMVVAGGAIAATTRRWAGPSSRYGSRVETVTGDTTGPTNAVSDWDSLSAGDDPTRPPGSR